MIQVTICRRCEFQSAEDWTGLEETKILSILLGVNNRKNVGNKNAIRDFTVRAPESGPLGAAVWTQGGKRHDAYGRATNRARPARGCCVSTSLELQTTYQ